jgi:hypothetical protein
MDMNSPHLGQGKVGGAGRTSLCEDSIIVHRLPASRIAGEPQEWFTTPRVLARSKHSATQQAAV